MNARSLKVQLVVWYAAVLTGCFGLIGAVTYLALQGSLTRALKQTQLRRARQVGYLLRETLQNARREHLAEWIEESYAPSQNNRFVRITRSNGEVIGFLRQETDRLCR